MINDGDINVDTPRTVDTTGEGDAILFYMDGSIRLTAKTVAMILEAVREDKNA